MARLHDILYNIKILSPCSFFVDFITLYPHLDFKVDVDHNCRHLHIQSSMRPEVTGQTCTSGTKNIFSALSTPSTFQVPQLWHWKLKHWNVPLAKSHRGHRRALCAEGGRHHLGGLLDLLIIGHQGLCMACHLDDHLAGQPLDHLSDHQAGWPFKKRKVQNLGFRCWKLIQQLVTSQENIFFCSCVSLSTWLLYGSDNEWSKCTREANGHNDEIKDIQCGCVCF